MRWRRISGGNDATKLRIKQKEKICLKLLPEKTDQTKSENMIQDKSAVNESIKRARKIMKLYHTGGAELHSAEAGKAAG